MKQIAMALILMVSVLQGATIRVPQDQGTIQAGINAAVDGDTVLVGPGTYSENLTISGKGISLVSVSGPPSTTIVPASTSSNTIYLSGNSGMTNLIQGFRFSGVIGKHCIESEDGTIIIAGNDFDNNSGVEGAVFVWGPITATIRDNRFENNSGPKHGGGLLIISSSSSAGVLVEKNEFRHNSARYGGGIDLLAAQHVTVRQNVFVGNSATEYGGAIYLGGSNDVRITNNTIDSCSSLNNTGGGISYWACANDTSFNNIISNCAGYGIWQSGSSGYLVDYNNCYMNSPSSTFGIAPGGGSLSVDPKFVGGNPFDYNLQASSPCINAGDPNPIYNDPDGSRNDMGAFPFISPDTRREVPQEYPTIQSAINAAVDGDTVLVDDGHYYERISFLGKKIIVTSNYLIDSDTLHIYQTIIDGDTAFVPLVGDTGSVVRFVNDEDSSSSFIGFSITGGLSELGLCCEGASMICISSGPRISWNRIVNNLGTAVYIETPGAPTGGATLQSCVISGNLGTGIYGKYDRSRILLIDCTITNNGGDGIGTPWQRAYIDVQGGRIANNLALGYNSYSPGNIRDCIIEGNTGGGVGWGSKSGTLETSRTTNGDSRASTSLLRVTIRNNGHGVRFYDHEWAIDSCLFEDNSRFGIGIGIDSKAVVTNSIFRNNGDGTGYGGAIRFITDQLVGMDCTNTLFEGNEAEFGGAIGQTRRSMVTLTSCTFVNNSADSGSAIYQSNGGGKNALIDKCTFSANNGGPVIVKSLSSDTSSWGTSVTEFTCTNIFGNEGGDWIDSLAPQFGVNGNISANPLFCDTAAGDYRIKDSSPCALANNSCGVLIGAYGIGCVNIAPVLTSANSVQAVSGLGFVYKATSTDVDGPSTAYSFINLPAWLTANGDSAFGIPPLTDIDTSFMVIVSDGFLADSMTVTLEITESPIISALTTEGVAVAMNVISHTPTFGWQYFDATGSYPQTQFEIAVGSDADWTYAELWNPAPFNGAATNKQYAGAALEDGQTYWVRARVRNALIWSNWKQTSFRMNSVPGVPEMRLPVELAIVNTEHPTLVVRNPSDAENDSMLITFELSADSFATSIFPIEVNMSSDSLTSFWVNFPLNEDLRFWWRVKASDYYEESGYSQVRSFWINSVNSTPTAFSLLSPPNGSSPALPINMPEFTWQNSLDIDPGDSVEFTLQLAIDPSFSFMSQISGLTSPHYLTATPLEWGRRYWWRVKAEDKSSGVRWSNETFDFKIMALGDADGSGTVTISDVVYLISYIFGGGPAPNPIESGDADCSGAVTISDVVYLINYIFAGTAAPCEG